MDTIRFEPTEHGTKMIHIKSGKSIIIGTKVVKPLKEWMQDNGSLYYDGDSFRQAGGDRYSAIKIIAALGTVHIR